MQQALYLPGLLNWLRIFPREQINLMDFENQEALSSIQRLRWVAKATGFRSSEAIETWLSGSDAEGGVGDMSNDLLAACRGDDLALDIHPTDGAAKTLL